MVAGKRILVVIGGGISAYKSLILIRLARAAGLEVVPVLTRAGAEFVTPLSVSALAGQAVRTEMFDADDETRMGHIELSRSADLIVVAPATADLMAKMAGGRADDLASTLLLATDTPVLAAPAMNVRMWHHPATQRNLAQLRADGIAFVGPDEGDMACGEYGLGRMAEAEAILAAITARLAGPAKGQDRGALAGRHIIVTSGPTHEPIDPVRYIANRSSGAQGAALAAALRDLGARVTFVTGPAAVPSPSGVQVVAVETAAQMAQAVMAALPADGAVMAAAVADWRVKNQSPQKMKKIAGGLPVLEFAENPDILASLCAHAQRPRLVVGFAAETQDVAENAAQKRLRKGCDWIVANDVSPESGIMGGAENAITLITAAGAEAWPRLTKVETAQRLAQRMAEALAKP